MNERHSSHSTYTVSRPLAFMFALRLPALQVCPMPARPAAPPYTQPPRRLRPRSQYPLSNYVQAANLNSLLRLTKNRVKRRAHARWVTLPVQLTCSNDEKLAVSESISLMRDSRCIVVSITT